MSRGLLREDAGSAAKITARTTTFNTVRTFCSLGALLVWRWNWKFYSKGIRVRSGKKCSRPCPIQKSLFLFAFLQWSETFFFDFVFGFGECLSRGDAGSEDRASNDDRKWGKHYMKESLTLTFTYVELGALYCDVLLNIFWANLATTTTQDSRPLSSQEHLQYTCTCTV